MKIVDAHKNACRNGRACKSNAKQRRQEVISFESRFDVSGQRWVNLSIELISLPLTESSPLTTSWPERLHIPSHLPSRNASADYFLCWRFDRLSLSEARSNRQP